jgi:hypothetical protein
VEKIFRGSPEPRSPRTDRLELLRVVDRNVHAEVHPLLRKVDIETRNLGVLDPELHRCERGQLGITGMARPFIEVIKSCGRFDPP